MKKLITAIIAFTFTAFTANAEVRVGITAAFTDFEVTGKETLKSSSNVTNGSNEESVLVPSLFIEARNEFGVGVGLDFVPAEAEIGDKSKTKIDTDTDDASDTSGVNRAKAEVSSHYTVYATIPVKMAFIKLGYVSADVDTTEKLATGTSYGNETVNGTYIGIGIDRDLPNGFFVRAEAGFTDYDDISLQGSADADSVRNKVDADIDATSLRLSVGKAF